MNLTFVPQEPTQPVKEDICLNDRVIGFVMPFDEEYFPQFCYQALLRFENEQSIVGFGATKENAVEVTVAKAIDVANTLLQEAQDLAKALGVEHE